MSACASNPAPGFTLALGGSMGRQQRIAARRDREKDHKKRARAKLKELRAQLRVHRLKQENAIAETKLRCRAQRVEVSEHGKMTRLRVLEDLRKALEAERIAARTSCSIAKDEAHAATDDAVKRARAELEAERKYQEDLQRIERGNRKQHRESKRASSSERRTESDDEVRANLDPEFLALFERVKRSIKAGPRETRTEAFLKYAEEHPKEVLASIDDKTEAMIRDLERQEREAARHVRRKRFTDAELAEVPF